MLLKFSLKKLGSQGANYFNFTHFLFVHSEKKMSWIFKILKQSNFVGGFFLKLRSCINHPWDSMRSHTKFEPDRFSLFDVYWIQTNKQTDKPNLYIDVATQNDERNKRTKCILNSNLQLNLKNEIYIFGLVFMLWKWMTIF